MNIKIILLAGASVLTTQAAHSDIKLSDTLTFKADLRTGYFGSRRDDRDNSKSHSDELRLRARFGLKAQVSKNLNFNIRWAGRYSTADSNNPNFEFFDAIPSGDGLRRGDSTIDKLYLEQKLGAWKIRFGRQQTSFELTGVAKKSLDRNDSPNTDINWTDGLYAIHKGGNGWNTHLIMQFNPKQGSTEVRRSPLNFEDSDARVSYFASYESRKKSGSIVQRAIDVTYLPSALRKDGTAVGRIENYWAVVGRLALAWPVGNKGTKFVLGMEAGYAPETSTLAAKSLSGSGDTDGFAGQITFNLVNFKPRHSVGLVLGRAGAGYLLSPDFRENNNLVELRYKWAIDKKQKLEARIRRRTEIKQLSAASEKRVDDDVYIRYTYKF